MKTFAAEIDRNFLPTVGQISLETPNGGFSHQEYNLASADQPSVGPMPNNNRTPVTGWQKQWAMS